MAELPPWQNRETQHLKAFSCRHNGGNLRLSEELGNANLRGLLSLPSGKEIKDRTAILIYKVPRATANYAGNIVYLFAFLLMNTVSLL